MHKEAFPNDQAALPAKPACWRAPRVQSKDSMVLAPAVCQAALPAEPPGLCHRHRRFAGGEDGRVFQPQEEAQLVQALVDAVMAGGCGSRAGGAAEGGAGGAAGASLEGPLQHLCARVALARAKAATAAGAGEEAAQDKDAEDVAAEELQALQLEARDAADALLQRCRDVAALRRSLLKQPEQLGALAEAGQDGAPRPLPLLRQIVGEQGPTERADVGCGWSLDGPRCLLARRRCCARVHNARHRVSCFLPILARTTRLPPRLAAGCQNTWGHACLTPWLALCCAVREYPAWPRLFLALQSTSWPIARCPTCEPGQPPSLGCSAQGLAALGCRWGTAAASGGAERRCADASCCRAVPGLRCCLFIGMAA